MQTVGRLTPLPSESRVDAVLARLLPSVEHLLQRTGLPHGLRLAAAEFLVFGVKQAWACLFGGLLLAALLASALWWPEGAALARYDALFFFAVAVQALFLLTRFERPSEALVILIFHVVGTGMEVFKTHAGSWAYPEASVIAIGAVPLFSGFMYASVGSYMARALRVSDIQFTHYPRRRATIVVAVLIYLNFFSHHFLPDVRLLLFAGAAWLFRRTTIYFSVWRWQHRMPMLLGLVLVAFFLWLAENIGTLTGTWVYPNQTGAWEMVHLSKMGAWFLLMLISWTLVTLVHPPKHRQRLPASKAHIVDEPGPSQVDGRKEAHSVSVSGR